MTVQPIIRGIQTVGHVEIRYRYNLQVGQNFYLPIPKGFKFLDGTGDEVTVLASSTDGKNQIDLGTAGALVAGFRLDSEFLRANPQIASSFTIPLLGGGGISLTNNNRTGTLNMVCAKVSVPELGGDTNNVYMKQETGGGAAIGVDSTNQFYDMVTLAQLQQAQEGGDPYGANISFVFEFSGVETTLEFQACTVATVDPIGLAGNDAVNYNITFNYLNWTCEYKKVAGKQITVNSTN